MIRFGYACCVMMMAVALSADSLENQFLELPMSARRNTGPLFWLHGDETPERLNAILDKVAEGGNGAFTAESRPHKDWLGEGWYRDLGVCLDAAKRLDLKMWLFDEDWWPSQTVGGKVPPQYAAKKLMAKAETIAPGGTYAGAPGERANFIALVAGRVDAEGAVESDTLRDLTPLARKGPVRWTPPADGKAWQVMTFSWGCAPALKQGNRLAVDGMSPDCVNWYIQTVYEPHHARFGKDFGKTIPGYFYDEPETPGDWGTELDATFKTRGVDWMPCYVAWLFKLAGDAQAAAKYQYAESRAETWGRVMFGGLSEWCRQRGVLSIGHFMEHGMLYVNDDYCAGDMMRLQKYSGMGGIDAVFNQFAMGQRDTRRDPPCWQTPKLASSISHVYGKTDDLAMCEIFGARGQDLSYPEMKWWTDHMQVSGVNFLIPHSFNPRAPYDADCPPYFFNGGFEPRFELYRVWADYASRLSLMLSGGRHVCPMAVLFSGNARQAGAYTTPEDITTALQDALYDCDWLPLERFEDSVSQIEGNELHLHGERYRALIVPHAEAITWGTLAKALAFFEAGGTVIGYGRLPSVSLTPGKTAADIAALRAAIWGDAQPGTKACKTSAAGGRSYFLPAEPTVEQLQQALGADAGVRPALEVVKGETGGWLHVLHRVKDGCDVFLVCNQNHTGDARRFTFRVTASGEPECWDAMRNELTSAPFKRLGENQVEVDLTLEPSESVALVFRKEKRALPARLDAASKPLRAPVSVVREATPPERVIPGTPPVSSVAADPDEPLLTGCDWVWGPEGSPARAAPPGTQYFRGTCALPAAGDIKSARFIGTCDNQFTLFVNGRQAGQSSEESEGWRALTTIDVAPLLAEGANVIAIAAKNLTDKPSPAGLIGLLEVVVKSGAPRVFRVDAAWRTSGQALPNWNQVACDDAAWAKAKSVGKYGCAPWGFFAGEGPQAKRLTVSPVTSDPFVGHCELPTDVDLGRMRVFVEMDELAPEEAARVTVNGQHAGGFIGKPFRLEVTRHVKAGANRIVIEPFAPKGVRLTVWPK